MLHKIEPDPINEWMNTLIRCTRKFIMRDAREPNVLIINPEDEQFLVMVCRTMAPYREPVGVTSLMGMEIVRSEIGVPKGKGLIGRWEDVRYHGGFDADNDLKAIEIYPLLEIDIPVMKHD